MRKFLFRGQTRRKGEKIRMDGTPVESNWVYGGIYGEASQVFSIIYSYNLDKKFLVYSDTVGEYTGLIDRNNTNIFEGDILQIRYNDVFLSQIVNKMVVWHGNGWCIKQVGNEEYYGYEPLKEENQLLYAEVIGNIYDNPELLEDKSMDEIITERGESPC